MNIQQMPVLRPVPIRTKELGLLTPLWRWMTAKRTWRIDSDFEYQLPDDGRTIVIPGPQRQSGDESENVAFDFDGASVPRLLRPVLSPIGLLLIAGLIHDFGYRFDFLLERDGQGNYVQLADYKGKKTWDRLFRKVARDVNGFGLVYYVAWFAVFAGGWFAWRSNRKRDQKPYWTTPSAEAAAGSDH